MIKNQNINTLILQTEDHWEQVGTDDFYFIFSYFESKPPAGRLSMQGACYVTGIWIKCAW